ncbi:DUF2299 family protein [Candidatus Palauibacter sp.]|uniref:DUF2299 family protein n=1 Tax=Candidatus Palauibacter sp. TaxID=3101350 RepID=UPI003AF1FBFA
MVRDPSDARNPWRLGGGTVHDVNIEDAGWTWGVVVTTKPEPSSGVLVAQRSEDPGYIAIQSNIVVSDDHLATLASLTDRALRTFLADLKLTIFAIPVEAVFAGEVPEGERRDGSMEVTLTRRLVDEQVTRVGFFAGYRAVRSASNIFKRFEKLAAR